MDSRYLITSKYPPPPLKNHCYVMTSAQKEFQGFPPALKKINEMPGLYIYM